MRIKECLFFIDSSLCISKKINRRGTQVVCAFMFLVSSLNAQSWNVTSQVLSPSVKTAESNSIESLSDSSRYYLRSYLGEPWTQTNEYSNVGLMNSVFGLDGWTQGFIELIDINNVFNESVSVVVIDGSDDGALAFDTFLATNIAAIESWVYNGGRLFLNSAPNEGGDIDLGFENTILNYGPDYITAVEFVNENHLILQGPEQDVLASYTGDYFAHAYISGDYIHTIIKDTSILDRPVLAEKFWGDGLVLFGSLTSTQWHMPLYESLNLKKNILHYLAAYQPCAMTLECPEDIVVNIEESCCLIQVNYDEPYIGGLCDGDLFLNEGLSSGEEFPVGTTSNTYQVINEYGDTLSCSFEVSVLDPNDTLGTGIYHSLSGFVFTENQKPIEGVSININQGYLSTNTIEDGSYIFEQNILNGSAANIDVSYPDYLTNGVTTFDMALITRHILGVQALDSPYKLIAADVNNSKTITTLDIILIRKAILQLIDHFPNNDSWKFISADEDLDWSNPWDYNGALRLDAISIDSIYNIIGIKIGDVSNSVNVMHFKPSF
jgi:hypothetical protein